MQPRCFSSRWSGWRFLRLIPGPGFRLTPTERERALIRSAVVRMRARIMALVLGMAAGTGVFVATAWLLLRGGDKVAAYLLLATSCDGTLTNLNNYIQPLDPPGGDYYRVLPEGRVDQGSRELVVRTLGRMQAVKDFNDLIVASSGGLLE